MLRQLRASPPHCACMHTALRLPERLLRRGLRTLCQRSTAPGADRSGWASSWATGVCSCAARHAAGAHHAARSCRKDCSSLYTAPTGLLAAKQPSRCTARSPLSNNGCDVVSLGSPSALRQRISGWGRRAGVAIAGDALVLGIESSCDDTGVAVVRASDGAILGQARPTGAQTCWRRLRRGSSSGGTACAARARTERRGGARQALATQVDVHAPFGGVVPSLAMEAHAAALDGTVAAALRRAGVAPGDLAAVAVTVGPGLAMCLQARPQHEGGARPRAAQGRACMLCSQRACGAGDACGRPRSAIGSRMAPGRGRPLVPACRAPPRPRCRPELGPERAQGQRAGLGTPPRRHGCTRAHRLQRCAAPAGRRAQGAAAGGGAPTAAGARAPHGGARAGAARPAAGAARPAAVRVRPPPAHGALTDRFVTLRSPS